MHPTIEGISKSIPSLPTYFYMVVCFTLDEALLNSTLLLYTFEPQRIYNVLILILTHLTVSAKIYKNKKRKQDWNSRNSLKFCPFWIQDLAFETEPGLESKPIFRSPAFRRILANNGMSGGYPEYEFCSLELYSWKCVKFASLAALIKCGNFYNFNMYNSTQFSNFAFTSISN